MFPRCTRVDGEGGSRQNCRFSTVDTEFGLISFMSELKSLKFECKIKEPAQPAARAGRNVLKQKQRSAIRKIMRAHQY